MYSENERGRTTQTWARERHTEIRPHVSRTDSGSPGSPSVGLRGVTVAGMGESDGPDTVVRHMQIFAEQIDDLQADLAMLAEKMKQIFAPNVGHLQGLQGLGWED